MRWRPANFEPSSERVANAYRLPAYQAKPFLEAVRKVAPWLLPEEKHGIRFFSIGGGIGIVYQGTLDSGVQEWWNEDCAQLTLSTYAQAVVPTLQPLGLHIIVEPGRLIVGNAGALITRCLYEKTGKPKPLKLWMQG